MSAEVLGTYYCYDTLLFESSWRTGELPVDWRNAKVTSAFRKWNKEDPGQSASPQTLKRWWNGSSWMLALSTWRKRLPGLLRINQGKTMADQPNSLLWWDDWVDEKKSVYLEFSKGLDTTFHNILIIKLRKWGQDKWGTVKWIEGWVNDRSQRAEISNTGCSWRPATSGVPQEYWVQSSTWVISDTEGAELTLSKLADDKKN